MAAAESLLRGRVKSVVEAEFTAEGFTVGNDKLTRAAGRNGAAELAVYPLDAYEDPKQIIRLIVRCTLQVYLPYSATPDESIVVDPGVIEGYAERLRDAFQHQSGGSSGDLWYLRLTSVTYPDDPTGNKSRLEATFMAYADNTASIPG